jgi:hypothetical protein
LRKEIIRIYKDTINNKAVSADYRTLARQFMASLQEEVDFSKLAGKRRESVERMTEWVERQKALGEDVTITEEMLKQMRRLDKKPISEMRMSELVEIRDQINLIKEVGRNKKRIRERLLEARIEKATQDVIKDVRQRNMWEYVKHRDDTLLTRKEKLLNAFARAYNWAKETEAGITPPDTVFDLMGSGTARYDEGPFRIFKGNHDSNWYDLGQEYAAMRTEMENLKLDLELGERNMIRINAANLRRQGEDIIERAVAGGFDEEFIRSVKLTDKEEQFAEAMDRWLNYVKPDVRRAGIEMFNREFTEVEDYFPILTDWSKSTDLDMMERFGRTAPQVQGKRSKTKLGATIERIKGADTEIEKDAFKIFVNHMKNALYVKHMAEDIYIAQRVAKSAEFREAAGSFNTYLAQEYTDLMARMGGKEGADAVWWVSTINRNVGVAILGYKLSSALIQLSAIPQGAALTSGTYMSLSLKDITTKAPIRNFVIENFVEIRQSVGDDLAFLDRPTMQELEWIQNNSYWLLKKFDGVSRAAAALASYRKYLDKNNIPFDINNPNKEAILAAQLTTRLSQSSSLWKDAPMIYTRGMGAFGSRDWNRLFFKFMSYPLFSFALATKTTPGMIRAGKKSEAAWSYMWQMTSLLSEVGLQRSAAILLAFLTGKDLSKDEESFIQDTVEMLASRVPFVGPAISMVKYDSTPFAAYKGLDDISRGVRSINLFDGEFTHAEFRGWLAIVTGLGTLYGIPGMLQAQQLFRDLSYTLEEGAEDAGSPAAGSSERPGRPERPARPTR